MRDREQQFGNKSIRALARRYPAEALFAIGTVVGALALAHFSTVMAIAMVGVMYVDAHLQLWAVCREVPVLLEEERASRLRAEGRAEEAGVEGRTWAWTAGQFGPVMLDDPELN